MSQSPEQFTPRSTNPSPRDKRKASYYRFFFGGIGILLALTFTFSWLIGSNKKPDEQSATAAYKTEETPAPDVPTSKEAGTVVVYKKNETAVISTVPDAKSGKLTSTTNHYPSQQKMAELIDESENERKVRSHFGIDTDPSADTHGSLCFEGHSHSSSGGSTMKKDYVVLEGPKSLNEVKRLLATFQKFKNEQSRKPNTQVRIDVLYLDPNNQIEPDLTGGKSLGKKTNPIMFDVDAQTQDAKITKRIAVQTIRNLIPKTEKGPAVDYDIAYKQATKQVY